MRGKDFLNSLNSYPIEFSAEDMYHILTSFDIDTVMSKDCICSGIMQHKKNKYFSRFVVVYQPRLIAVTTYTSIGKEDSPIVVNQFICNTLEELKKALKRLKRTEILTQEFTCVQHIVSLKRGKK